MNFNIILAVDSNGGISKTLSQDSIIPWSFQIDMEYFKKLTLTSLLPGKFNSVIMGRKTFQSFKKYGKSYLPGRINIVISKNEELEKDNIIVVNSFNKALEEAKALGSSMAWVIGGKEIYDIAFKHHKLEKVFITTIKHDFNCDMVINLPPLLYTNSSIYEDVDRNTGLECKICSVIGKPIYNSEQQYLRLLEDVLVNGDLRQTRNGETLSTFSKELKFNVNESFPLLTTKKMFWRGIVEELLFFIRGDIDTKKLEEKKINIWKGNTNSEFLKKLNLEYEEGIMGPMYGYQWRFFNKPIGETTGGVDQLKDLIDLINKDPHSRRLIMTDYNPLQVKEGVLYPCHSLILQFYATEKTLSVKMYQRSADLFLGLPFNIASTSLLLYIIAKICNKIPQEVIISLGDCHIYKEHENAVLEQLSKNQLDLPKLKIPDFKNIEEVENSNFEDYIISDYQHQGSIKAEMIA